MRLSGLLGALIFGSLTAAPVQSLANEQTQQPRDLIGSWKFRDTGEVLEFFACGTMRCARLVALAPGERQAQDFRNPVPALRARPLCNLTVVEGLRAASPSKWTHGSAYSPEDGNVYEVRVDVVTGDTANLRANLRAMPLLGRTYKLDMVATTPNCKRY